MTAVFDETFLKSTNKNIFDYIDEFVFADDEAIEIIAILKKFFNEKFLFFVSNHYTLGPVKAVILSPISIQEMKFSHLDSIKIL